MSDSVGTSPPEGSEGNATSCPLPAAEPETAPTEVVLQKESPTVTAGIHVDPRV